MEAQKLGTEVLKKLDSLDLKIGRLIEAQHKNVSGNDYVNAVELASLLGESLQTVYKRVHYREIPYYKPGGKSLLFKVDEVQEWIKKTRQPTVEEIRQRT